MPAVATKHITVDSKGVARITGSRIKVQHLVVNKRAHGWSPEEMKRQFPHLSLAEIHAAFAYYYDHQADIDAQIERDQKECETLSERTGPQPFDRKLRKKGGRP